MKKLYKILLFGLASTLSLSGFIVTEKSTEIKKEIINFNFLETVNADYYYQDNGGGGCDGGGGCA